LAVLREHRVFISASLEELVEDEEEEEKRLDEFGDWLDNDQDDLPEEFRLNVEK
jgi:hypothetical protein